MFPYQTKKLLTITPDHRWHLVMWHDINTWDTCSAINKQYSNPTNNIRLNKIATPPRESTLYGRWTRKHFGLSRVQPIYLNVPRPSYVYVDFILTLQVTKKNPLWHTVPRKIITSLILVIKIWMKPFNAKRLLYYNKIIIYVEQMKIMWIFVFEIELKKIKNKHPFHPAAKKWSCGRIYFTI